ncbi:hypothetical protein [Flavobacterium sp. 7A]|uniref:hypothetical protein n=1 Tax=Flavobacterium sp. 7A TaxID=2940571 RepID=UPI002226304F|nr:hypothetical protein [Flavobacterium sp. 7A]MCW2118616.1 hypothetical protein [Flavobacterium sp. 7A]
MKKVIYLGILISFLSCKKAEHSLVEDNLLEDTQKSEVQLETQAEYQLPEYSFITKNDISFRTEAVVEAPVNKRFSYKFLVSNKITREQIKLLFSKLIKEITSEDKDIDDITIWLYSDKELVEGTYDVAMATWGPEDGEVTKNIAVSNNRESYKLEITISDNLEEYLKNKSEKKVSLGLTYDLRKNIYQELANTETRARAKLDKIYPYTANFDTDNYANKLDELTKKYEKEISKKYKIDTKTMNEIYEEGDKNGWYNY